MCPSGSQTPSPAERELKRKVARIKIALVETFPFLSYTGACQLDGQDEDDEGGDEIERNLETHFERIFSTCF